FLFLNDLSLRLRLSFDVAGGGESLLAPQSELLAKSSQLERSLVDPRKQLILLEAHVIAEISVENCDLGVIASVDAVRTARQFAGDALDADVLILDNVEPLGDVGDRLADRRIKDLLVDRRVDRQPLTDASDERRLLGDFHRLLRLAVEIQQLD